MEQPQQQRALPFPVHHTSIDDDLLIPIISNQKDNE
jgi:hypothetical protein